MQSFGDIFFGSHSVIELCWHLNQCAHVRPAQPAYDKNMCTEYINAARHFVGCDRACVCVLSRNSFPAWHTTFREATDRCSTSINRTHNVLDCT